MSDDQKKLYGKTTAPSRVAARGTGSGSRIPVEYFWLLVIVGVGAIFRFKGLTFQGLWIDELFSFAESRPHLGLSELIGQFTTGDDPHPPLFYILLHYAFVIFGYSELTGRAFAALIGTLGLVAVFQLGTTLGNRRCGLLASLFLLLNHFHLLFSQEVRSYGLLFLLATLSYTYFVKTIKCLRTRDLTAYAIFTTLMAYTHYYGLVVAASQAIFLASYLAFQRPLENRGRLAMRFVLAGAGVIVLYLPWLPVILKNMEREVFWAGEPQGSYFIEVFERFLGNEPYLLLLAGALSLGVLFYIVSRKVLEGSGRAAESEDLSRSVSILFCWMFFCIFIPYYRSIADVPMLSTRYEIVILPAFLVLIALGVRLLRSPLMVFLVVTSFLLISWINVFHHQEFYGKIRKEQLREAAAFVMRTEESRGEKRPFRIYSDMAGFYNTYFELLGSDLRVQFFNKANPAQMLGKGGKQSVGFWLLSGPRPTAPEVTGALREKGVQEIEAGVFHQAAARLYLRKAMHDG